ncbi:hypothetical protein [Roseivirga misakiensis]|uniref:Uncharacterized protein n=1 Tax=Roseivirga misakiensis TaxID=1563681 RepID=A0A1E5SK50_9BACT|nr:hypothetical protein [Roseivirga misakiensis]OEJ99499.1 hypothetical protein BFP71_07920 [Roseivirga misakiensis]
MKRTILFLTLATCFLWSCDNNDEPTAEESSVLILMVDYNSNTFQAGATLFTPKVDLTFSELPVTADIQEPTNDLNGSVSLTLTPTSLQIFNAEISETGDAIVFAPSFVGAGNFFMLVDELPFPSALVVDDIEGPYTEPFETTWDAISKLNIVDLYRQNDALFGRYLYKPSETITDNWKWIIMIYNQ